MCKNDDDIEELHKYANFLDEKKNSGYYSALSGIAVGLINIIIYGNLNQDSAIVFFKNIFLLKRAFLNDKIKIIVDDLLTFEYPLLYTKYFNQLFIILLGIEANGNDNSFLISLLYPYISKIKSIVKRKNEFNIKEIAIKISEFFMSDTFILLQIINEKTKLIFSKTGKK